ncbi:YggS family pyridoxal phosphate enzyme [Alloprevotella rava F0323]|uniref:Pyridoxal phosphate homeostasis protein n=1 Tax=Alloprevotella rava F0323 TaxID=679199 RepID=G5G9H5_9BACT|nr:YggS family pyridoxal phosphate-dependent enzyme [Alloprevotella rava]EHG24389.1 YggS family pyridoxal phosphate enzyme [Alloprevotella rava F0323]
MTEVQQNLAKIREQLPTNVQLVAVSKFHPAEMIQQCYDQGQRIFGESHEQELRIKFPALPKDIEWHFIGHLQTNKVKYIAPYISLIHAVDSFKLMKEINKQAARNNRIIRILLELHIAEETTKFGLSLADCRTLFEESEWRDLKNIQICGLMCMASNTDDMERVRKDFETARIFFEEIKAKYFPNDETFCERSWGMTHDFQIAAKEGSTMVRVGTAIFGERQY